MSLGSLNVRDFELYLLKTMLPPDSLLAAALNELGCSVDDMIVSFEAVDRATKLGRVPQGNMISILEDVLVRDLNVDIGTFAYGIPLWSELTFMLAFDGSGTMITRAEFVRRVDLPPGSWPVPWNFVEHEMDDVFDEIGEFNDWGHYHSCIARVKNSDERQFLRFAWGLLQEAEPVED